MGDLASCSIAQRLPTRGPTGIVVGGTRRSATPRAWRVRVQRPAAVERGDADRRRVGDAELADGDGHQCAVLDRAAHRGVQRRGLAVAQPHLDARAGAGRRRCADSGRTARRSTAACCWLRRSSVRPHSTSGPGPAGRITVSADHHAAAAGHRAHGAVERHLEAPACRRRAPPARRRTSRPRVPSSERAGTTALTTRWIGTKASSSAHHHRRHRAGSHGPDTVSTAASIAIQRGSSRNCESDGVEPVGQVEVPSRRGEAARR